MKNIKLVILCSLYLTSFNGSTGQACPGGQGRVALCNGAYYGCANHTTLLCNGNRISCYCPENKSY